MESLEKEIPNYVLRAKEAMLVPKNYNPWLSRLKKAIWIIVGVTILGSILLQENLYGELSTFAQVMLVVLLLGITFSGGGHHRIPSPFEIRFYDDYLIVYREKHYYSPKVSRKEYDKFFYKDIHKIQFRKNTQRINIYGIVEGIWYNYNKDGTLPEKPTYHETTDSICYFYTSADPDVDFVAEIERHSPIKVIVDES